MLGILYFFVIKVKLFLSYMSEKQNQAICQEDFRKFGYEIIDFIANYFENLENYPVLSQNQPNDLKNALPISSKAKVFHRFWGCGKLNFAGGDALESSKFSRTFFDFDQSVGVFGEMLSAAFLI